MEEWEVVHAAVGKLVNASTLSKRVPEMNEERST